MLVLGRKPGEYVVINDKIIVKVVRNQEGLLRLAIDAPQDINIMRGELFEEQQQVLFRESQN
jgi:carbon storage regulator